MALPRGDKFVARPYDSRIGKHKWLGTYDTEREANAVEHEYLTNVRPQAGMKISVLRSRWLEEGPTFRGWKPSTCRMYADATRHFSDTYGSMDVREYTVPDAMSYAARYVGRVPKIRSMFAYARRLGIIETNPFSDLGMRTAEQSTIQKGRGALTEKEVWDLAEIARDLSGQWHHAMIVVAAYTGLRAGELFALRHSDIRDGSISVLRAVDSRTMTETLPKSGITRTIPLPAVAAEAIASTPRRVDDPRVFSSPTGKRLHITRHHAYWAPVRKAFYESLPSDHWLAQRIDAAELARLAEPDEAKRNRMPSGHLFFHELRHTCATTLLQWGLSHADVAIMLGHQDNGDLVMRRYGHPSRDLAVQRLTEAYATNGYRPEPAAGSNPVAPDPSTASAQTA